MPEENIDIQANTFAWAKLVCLGKIKKIPDGGCMIQEQCDDR
jgi:hypothetical protein